MPLFFLRNLHISLRTKILLCVLMGAGYITAGCSLVRTVLSDRVLNPDLSWSILTNAVWRAVEVNLGIICANAPIARPLYLYCKGRLPLLQNPSTEYNRSETGRSHMRLWPWSKQRQNDQKPSKSTLSAFKRSRSDEQPTDNTLTSVEMGLPIQGYMTKKEKRHSHWIDLAEAKEEIDRAGEKVDAMEARKRAEQSEEREREFAMSAISGRETPDERSWTTRERLENERGFGGLRKGGGIV